MIEYNHIIPNVDSGANAANKIKSNFEVIQGVISKITSEVQTLQFASHAQSTNVIKMLSELSELTTRMAAAEARISALEERTK